jgi:hypothetical protein
MDVKLSGLRPAADGRAVNRPFFKAIPAKWIIWQEVPFMNHLE